METMTLLIADCSDDFRNALAQALQGQYRIQCCRTGREVLELLHREVPDLVVMDLMLPEIDGISLLQQLRDAGIRPLVLATTRLINDYVLDAATELEVAYMMMKPCDIRAMVGRIRDLLRQKPRPKVSAPDKRSHVSNILTTLGISSKLRGYHYLRTAILICADTPMQSVTKELYPAVAHQLQCTPAQVERSIRNAIQKSWENRSEEVWPRFFPENGSGTVERPSNAAFINRLADRIQLDQMELELPE